MLDYLKSRRQWIRLRHNSKLPLVKHYYNEKYYKYRNQIHDELAGLVLSPDIVIIDCDKTGPAILPWLKQQKFPYIEESISNNGYHAIGLGYDFILSKFRHFGNIIVPEYNGPGHIELYSGCNRNKYFVITGRRVRDLSNSNSNSESINSKLLVTRFVIEHVRSSTSTLIQSQNQNQNFNEPITNRDRKRLSLLLDNIDCSTLDYYRWSAVTSACKRLNCFNEWNKWCETDTKRYNFKKNVRFWNNSDTKFSLGYIISLSRQHK